MGKSIKRVFLDTNVCSKIASSANGADIEGAIKSQFSIVVSANTIDELLLGLCRSGTEDYFESDKERVRVAIGRPRTHSAKFLSTPLEFAFMAGANVKLPKYALGKKKKQEQVRVVLAAKSLAQLRNEGVEWWLSYGRSSQGRRYLMCEEVERNIKNGKQYYSTRLSDAKNSDLFLHDPLIWVKNLARIYQRQPHPSKLASAE